MSTQESMRFATLCAELGDRASDETGFVALHRLAALFRAEVEFRPLLVEALIAAPVESGTWKILADSEMYPEGTNLFPSECQSTPLPTRLRNTLAHELLHTLSFRTEEFGVEMELKKKETRSDAISRLEKETEGFSPLLLVPQKAMESDLEARGLSLSVLLDWRQRWAVSREVLVARLALFRSLPNFRLRYHPSVTDIAVCIAEWGSGGAVHLLEWPLFYNFRDGIIPEFIHQLRNKDKPSIGELFSDSNFILNGGSETSTQSLLPAGTAAMPTAERLEITAEAEDVGRNKGAAFLVVFRTRAGDPP